MGVLALAILLALGWLTTGLWERPAHAAAAVVRYRIEADGNRAWMVDSATGRVWVCDEGACRELPVTGLHPRPSR
jgi:hypothetical protein